MFEDFKKNLKIEKELVSKLRTERNESLRQSYVDLLNILNRSVPELMKKSSPVRNRDQYARSQPVQIESVFYSQTHGNVSILSIDKDVFTKALAVINQGKAPKKEKKKEAKTDKNAQKDFSTVKPSAIRSVSNSLFRGLSESTISNFAFLQKSVKAANMPILPTTYLAVAYFFTMITFIVAIPAYGVLLLLDTATYWTYFWVIVVAPIVVFACFLYYPKTEADAVTKEISYELPFATIHMTAVAGSNIEPSNLFAIMARSKEYPNIGREIQKVLVMIRVYGYDSVTALKNVASRTSNLKLSELLGGIASNISGGGELNQYLEKKSENYLLDYKLERKRYIDIASTFMDIYISILIAAPMILMLMFIIMNVSGIGFQGFSIGFLMMVSIIGIAIVNVIFLVVINLKQPKV